MELHHYLWLLGSCRKVQCKEWESHSHLSLPVQCKTAQRMVLVQHKVKKAVAQSRALSGFAAPLGAADDDVVRDSLGFADTTLMAP